METKIPGRQLLPLSEWVGRTTGLHFPPSRWGDLDRGICAAAEEFSCVDPSEFAGELLSGPVQKPRLDALARHLTVGETYFFREPRSFEMLAQRVLPALSRRAGQHRRLRIWSAGCCTGEEPYSIAMTLASSIPDLPEWDITLLATDWNPGFLCKAEAGVYGDWSFRGMPEGMKERFFRPVEGRRFELAPEIRRMVTFAQLNLVDDVYPSPLNDTGGMDIIFCRNVLMYFIPTQARKVMQNFHRAQPDGGWFFASANESADLLCPRYQGMNLGDVILYQKNPPVPAARPAAAQCAPTPINVPTPPPPRTAKKKTSGATKPPAPAPIDPAAFASLAHVLANEGKLAEALACCDQWIAAEKCNPAGHYLRSIVLQERNETDAAVQALVKAVYLDPHFVMAHFALGTIMRNKGRTNEAARHMSNALWSLRRFRPSEVLPESDGVTAGRLEQIIDSMNQLELAA